MDNDNGKSLECLESPEITKMEEESCENEYDQGIEYKLVTAH